MPKNRPLCHGALCPMWADYSRPPYIGYCRFDRTPTTGGNYPCYYRSPQFITQVKEFLEWVEAGREPEPQVLRTAMMGGVKLEEIEGGLLRIPGLSPQPILPPKVYDSLLRHVRDCGKPPEENEAADEATA